MKVGRTFKYNQRFYKSEQTGTYFTKHIRDNVLGLTYMLPFTTQIGTASSSFNTAASMSTSSTQLIASESFQATDASGNTVYVTVYCFYNSTSQGLTYLSVQQITADPNSQWEIAGGIGATSGTDSWSVTSSIEDPSYSANASSSSNPPSSWYFNQNGFLPDDQPNNYISWGQSTTVSVTTGVTIGGNVATTEGATTVGGSLSVSYSITYSWTESAFVLEPVSQTSTNDSWYFSDNQGLYSTPYSATSEESASIYAMANNYNHVWIRDWGQFVYFTWDFWKWSNVPTFDICYTNDGFTTPYLN